MTDTASAYRDAMELAMGLAALWWPGAEPPAPYPAAPPLPSPPPAPAPEPIEPPREPVTVSNLDLEYREVREMSDKTRIHATATVQCTPGDEGATVTGAFISDLPARAGGPAAPLTATGRVDGDGRARLSLELDVDRSFEFMVVDVSKGGVSVPCRGRLRQKKELALTVIDGIDLDYDPVAPAPKPRSRPARPLEPPLRIQVQWSESTALTLKLVDNTDFTRKGPHRAVPDARVRGTIRYFDFFGRRKVFRESTDTFDVRTSEDGTAAVKTDPEGGVRFEVTVDRVEEDGRAYAVKGQPTWRGGGSGSHFRQLKAE